MIQEYGLQGNRKVMYLISDVDIVMFIIILFFIFRYKLITLKK